MSEIYSRRMVLHSAPAIWAAGQQTTAGGSTLGRSVDPNVVMILAALLCALLCALGFNSVARCALRWSNRMAADANGNSSARAGAQAGLEKKALQELPRLVYSKGLRLAGSNPGECAICLSEFVPGEQVRVLPTCDHGFHLKCIDRWLAARSSCPTCRLCLSAPFQMAWSCAAGERRQTPLPGRAVLVPQESEGAIPGHCICNDAALRHCYGLGH